MALSSEYILTPAGELEKDDEVFLEDEGSVDFNYGFCKVQTVNTSLIGKLDSIGRRRLYKTRIWFLDCSDKGKEFRVSSEKTFRKVIRPKP